MQLYKDLGVNSKGVSSENVMLIGNVLVAGCDDGLIRLWDIKTGIYIYIYIYTLTTRHEGIQHETVHDTGNTDIKKN